MLFAQFKHKLKMWILIILLLLAMLLSSVAVKLRQRIALLFYLLCYRIFTGHTYGDVTQYAVILKRERDICINRIDKIRE